jgi:hypothetical protein
MASIPFRDMCCRACRHVWTDGASLPEGAVHCPKCDAHVCGCGCGIDMGAFERDADALWFDRSHGAAIERELVA